MRVLFFLFIIARPLLSTGQILFIHEKEYEIAPSGQITLNSKNADVTVIAEDRSTVFVSISRTATPKGKISDDGYTMDISMTDAGLSLQEKKDVSVGMVKYKSLDYKILIRTPRKVSLSLVGRDDKYRIDSVEGNLKVDADDGKLIINEFKGKSLDIKVEDSPVLIKNGGSGDLKLRMGDKNCDIINSIFTNVDLYGGSGTFKIHNRFSDVHTLRLNVEDGELFLNLFGNGGVIEARTAGGTIHASPEFKIEKKSTGFFQYTIGDGFGKIFASTRDGKLEITKQAKGE